MPGYDGEAALGFPFLFFGSPRACSHRRVALYRAHVERSCKALCPAQREVPFAFRGGFAERWMR